MLKLHFYNHKTLRHLKKQSFYHCCKCCLCKAYSPDTFQTHLVHPSFMNNADATSASAMSTVNIVSPVDQTDVTATSDKCIATTVSPGDQTDAAASLPDFWNTMQYENFFKKYDGLIARNRKLGCDHCAKCDSMNIKGIRV